jgi:hypothetical protein
VDDSADANGCPVMGCGRYTGYDLDPIRQSPRLRTHVFAVRVVSGLDVDFQGNGQKPSVQLLLSAFFIHRSNNVLVTFSQKERKNNEKDVGDDIFGCMVMVCVRRPRSRLTHLCQIN